MGCMLKSWGTSAICMWSQPNCNSFSRQYLPPVIFVNNNNNKKNPTYITRFLYFFPWKNRVMIKQSWAKGMVRNFWVIERHRLWKTTLISRNRNPHSDFLFRRLWTEEQPASRYTLMTDYSCVVFRGPSRWNALDGFYISMKQKY